jgi:hypothetical protein
VVSDLEAKLQEEQGKASQLRKELLGKEGRINELELAARGRGRGEMQAVLDTVRRDHERTLQALVEQHEYELQQQGLELQRLRTIERNAALGSSRE